MGCMSLAEIPHGLAGRPGLPENRAAWHKQLTLGRSTCTPGAFMARTARPGLIVPPPAGLRRVSLTTLYAAGSVECRGRMDSADVASVAGSERGTGPARECLWA